MNYIGSKYKLLPFLDEIIRDYVGNDMSQMIFCDLFAGTGIVGRYFKTKVRSVISNDWEYYSFVLNKNYIENHTEIANAKDYIAELNNVPLREDGFIYNNYCLGGSGERQYFSDNNGKKIDAIRLKIEEWKNNGYINESTYYFLLCSLLESADKLANTASVYGAYLKKLKKTAQKELTIEPAYFEINDNLHQVYCEDANRLINKIEGDVLYLDPPYNARQYGANYHLLNTIAEYKPFIPKGKTGMRNYCKSTYCSKSTIKDSFEDLIRQAQFRYIFLSYNNEGLMSCYDIKAIMQKYGDYAVRTKDYQRFKADKTENRHHKANSTVEFLHVLVK